MKRRTYTKEEQAILQKNPYTFKVTDNSLFFTAEFKRSFWASYQAGETPRTILRDRGYDLKMFTQSAIDSLTHRIKMEATSGKGFREGPATQRQRPAAQAEDAISGELMLPTPENMQRIWNEVAYLRQQVEFIKKVRPAVTEEIDG